MIFGVIKTKALVHIGGRFDQYDTCEAYCRKNIIGKDTSGDVASVDDTDPVKPAAWSNTKVCDKCRNKAPALARAWDRARDVS